jgi:hypothetical protein
MSCIRSPKKRKAEAKCVSTFEILARFEDEHETFSRLAFVIAGDMGAAERSVSEAREPPRLVQRVRNHVNARECAAGLRAAARAVDAS